MTKKNKIVYIYTDEYGCIIDADIKYEKPIKNVTIKITEGNKYDKQCDCANCPLMQMCKLFNKYC